ncbi:MAG: hypothetical protein JWQ66_3776 [Mucilaginibacter sp.]|nr:hypothetical protein [Mucilaginibacter sp.]
MKFPYSHIDTTPGKSILCICFATFFECDSNKRIAAITGAIFSAKWCSFIKVNKDITMVIME